jgi:tetratricopeptide (TPR) repeat protein
MAISRALSIRLLALLGMFAVTSVYADDLKDIAQQANQGQPNQALDRINAHVTANPSDVQALFMRAVMLAEQGKKEEAIKAFNDITQRFPGLPEPYNNLAVLYADQGQYDKARQALENAIKTHPSYATAHENLGDIYAKLASEAYGKALQLDTANARAQNKMLLIKELFSVTGKTGLAVNTAKPQSINTAPLPSTPNQANAHVELSKPASEKTEATANDDGNDANKSIQNAVNKWANAWSSKNVEAYLDAYADSFKAPNGESRKEWEKTRRERINKPEKIEVSVSNIKIKMDGDNNASVMFKQHYRSGKLSQGTTKTLDLVKVGGKWLIQQERAAR